MDTPVPGDTSVLTDHRGSTGLQNDLMPVFVLIKEYSVSDRLHTLDGLKRSLRLFLFYIRFIEVKEILLPDQFFRFIPEDLIHCRVAVSEESGLLDLPDPLSCTQCNLVEPCLTLPECSTCSSLMDSGSDLVGEFGVLRTG